MPLLKRKFWEASCQYLSPGKLRHEGSQIAFQADVTALASELASQPSSRGVLRGAEPFSSPFSARKTLGCRLLWETGFSQCFQQHFVWSSSDFNSFHALSTCTYSSVIGIAAEGLRESPQCLLQPLAGLSVCRAHPADLCSPPSAIPSTQTLLELVQLVSWQ